MHKTCNFKPLSHHKTLATNSAQFPPRFLGSTDLLKGHPAVARLLSDLLRGHPAVARSTNIYKQKTHGKSVSLIPPPILSPIVASYPRPTRVSYLVSSYLNLSGHRTSHSEDIALSLQGCCHFEGKKRVKGKVVLKGKKEIE